jgi:hypothetical protein
VVSRRLHESGAAASLGRLISLLHKAGSPLWRSLVASVTIDRPVIVCDAASATQSAVLTASPDQVLDGLLAVAASVGAHRVYLHTPPGIGAVAVRRAMSRRSESVRVVVERTARPGDIVADAAMFAQLGRLLR